MTRHAHRPVCQRRGQRGMGALVVVLALFFVMSLAAAYSGRNLIFEQKTSVNQYRSTQAFEAAEAGVEWALAMLNAGRIDASCLPSATATSFRQRYLTIDPVSGVISAGTWSSEGTPTALNPMCVRTAAGWSCSCPDAAAPVLAASAGSAPAPAFRLTFGSGGRPGVITLRSQACTRLDSNCLNDTPASGHGDSVATLEVLLALRAALATPPAAALTAGGTVDVSGANASMQLSNTEPLVNGLTVAARGAVIDATPRHLTLTSVPGNPHAVPPPDPSLPRGADPTRADPAAGPWADAAADRLFVSVFGIKPYTYKQQPATIVLTCPAQCGAASLSALAAKNPGRILWLEGDATLGAAVTLGSPTAPVVIVSHGNLAAGAWPVHIFGLVYVYLTDGAAGRWTASGDLDVQGALVAEQGIVVAPNSRTSVSYDLQGVLRPLRLASGSFVRVPGGWIDR